MALLPAGVPAVLRFFPFKVALLSSPITQQPREKFAHSGAETVKERVKVALVPGHLALCPSHDPSPGLCQAFAGAVVGAGPARKSPHEQGRHQQATPVVMSIDASAGGGLEAEPTCCPTRPA